MVGAERPATGMCALLQIPISKQIFPIIKVYGAGAKPASTTTTGRVHGADMFVERTHAHSHARTTRRALKVLRCSGARARVLGVWKL